ncbi:MAG: ABC transporter permease [Bacteroidales bacterium]|nr:ABC transporter permease [Bacteroidales bacterium]
MLRNYFLTTLRFIRRSPMFSLINIIGLSVGLAVGILIILYVFNELTYDRFHENAKRLYRVNMIEHREDAITNYGITTAAVGPSMEDELTGVEQTVRISYPEEAQFSYQQHTYHAKSITYTDSSFFDVFSFKLLIGDPSEALTAPYSVILTNSLAKKIYGNKNPVGEELILDNQEVLEVKGVIEDPPSNSQLQFEALVSFITLEQRDDIFIDWDGGWNYYTYVLLTKGVEPEYIINQTEPFLEKHINNKYRQFGLSLEMKLTPMLKLHLHSDAEAELETKGSLTNIYVFSAVAFFLILIASFNFVSLSTALATKRAKEVGMRKVTGAQRSQLISQFLSESVFFSLLALIIGLTLVELLQPFFNTLVNNNLGLYHAGNGLLIAGIVLLALFTGLLSGMYPAFHLSSFRPLQVIQGNIRSSGRKGFRNILVTIQFLISSVLIIMTGTVYLQHRFMEKKDIGYNRENLVVVPLLTDISRKNYSLLKSEFNNIPSVQASGASSAVPVDGLTSNGYFPEGFETPLMFNALDIDEDYIEAMQIQIADGRNFSADHPSDKEAFLINETLAKEVGWENPVGKTIRRDGIHTVIGVVKDFHFASMHNPIRPLIITNKPWKDFSTLTVRLNTNDLQKTIETLGVAWETINHGEPFTYYFLADLYDTMYYPEKQFGRMFLSFSFLSLLIAALGLLGLAAYTTEQRTKEVGIRKTMGATSGDIIVQFSSEFTRFVLLGNLLGWPLAYMAIRKWMTDFAYHINIPWWLFVFSVTFSLLIAVAAVWLRTSRTANLNPAITLKYE